MERKLATILRSPKGRGLGPNALQYLLKRGGTNASLHDIKKALGQMSDTRARLFQPGKDAPMLDHVRKYVVLKPNFMHHMDLLQLPEDQGIEWLLVVVDVASRYTAAQPLPGKTAAEVLTALKHIYDRTALDIPKTIHVDGGSEFRGVVASWLQREGVDLRVATPGNHKFAAFAERANYTIAKRLFVPMHIAEANSGRTNTKWLRNLPGVVESINDIPNGGTNIRPTDAIRRAEMPAPVRSEEMKRAIKQLISEDKDPLAVGTLVRYPLDKPPPNPGDLPSRNMGRFRATDLRFSKKKPITDILLTPDMPPEYIVDGRAWLRRQLNLY